MTPSFRGERVIQLKNVAGLDILHTRPSYHCVWKWTKYGIKGVRLECRREGRTVLTSVEAVERFLERTNGGGE